MWQCRLARVLFKPRVCNITITRYSSTFFDFSTAPTNEYVHVSDRTVAESKIERVLPFSSDEVLRAEYLSFRNQIRIGKLLENMDLAAGEVAYRHTDPSRTEYVIVTAACDRISLQRDFIDPKRDITINGFVTYVGRSSMEIRIEMLQDDSLLMYGYFAMAARDAKTFKSKQIPQLTLVTEKEREMNKAAIERKEQAKKQEKNNCDIIKPPTPEESLIIHDLYLERRKQCNDFSVMETRFDSTRYMHPRDQNVHGHIFGGHIMREAFELAYLTACNYVKASVVEFIVIDDIVFIAPVKIGDILQCSAFVTYCDPELHLVQVSVEAKVVNPENATKQKTNIFQISFRTPNTVAKVNPVTYAEGMKYLAGRRSCLELIERITNQKA